MSIITQISNSSGLEKESEGHNGFRESQTGIWWIRQ